MTLKNPNFKAIIILFFPISLILGSALVNLTLVVGSLFLLYESYKKKIDFLKIIWVKIFFLLIIYLCLISFFAENFFSSFRSSISLTRFILFSLFIFFFVVEKNFENLKNFISLLLVLVCIDVNIQFVFGYDIFGFPSEGYSDINYDILSHWKNDNVNVGRLSGPFKSELIPGAFISSLSVPLIFYKFKALKTENLFGKFKNILLVCLFLESTIITGERLSTLLILSCIFTSMIISFNLKKTIFIVAILSSSLFLLPISENNFLKKRWVDAFNIFLNVNESSYGRIYTSAYHVWKENKLFGVGLKNYRINCQKISDPNPTSPHPFCSPTHAHNLYFELLSETGLIGLIVYLSFYISLIIFLLKNINHKKKNKVIYYFGFGSLFYLFFKLLPLPTGSIFSTWNASIFWFHVGISLSFLCKRSYFLNK